MKLASVNCALVAPLFVGSGGQRQAVMSAIRKQPVQGLVEIRPLGLAGDEQADLSVHGGLDKAVYLYPHEHYAFWQAQLERVRKQPVTLTIGAIGENLTTQGLDEAMLWVGDKLRIGSVLLEVTEPRQPCFKFAAVMGYTAAVRHMVQSGYSGVYLKVIEPGTLQAGDGISLEPGRREVSIASINDQRLKGRQRELFG
jgi:MOSC domain-containing protein YiiM